MEISKNLSKTKLFSRVLHFTIKINKFSQQSDIVNLTLTTLVERCTAIHISGRKMVWRLINTWYEVQNVVTNRNSRRFSRSFWNWVNRDGIGSLVEIERRMTALDYRIILNDVLRPNLYPDAELLYVVEDNSRVTR